MATKKSRSRQRWMDMKATEAKARLAEAEARKAEVEARRARDRRAGSPTERLYKLGINLGAPVLGMFAGHKIAGRIGRLHVARIAAQNAELARLTNGIGPILTKAAGKRATGPAIAAQRQLRGIVATASRMKLGRAAGPLGLVAAGSLLAEGYYARSVLAPQVENPTGKEALRAVGTGSFFAASAIVGERLLANRTLAKLPDAAALAKIKAAEGLVGNVGKLSTVGRVLGKLWKPAMAFGIGVGLSEAYSKGGLTRVAKYIGEQGADYINPLGSRGLPDYQTIARYMHGVGRAYLGDQAKAKAQQPAGPAPGPATAPTGRMVPQKGTGKVWVPRHTRAGKDVKGFYRERGR